MKWYNKYFKQTKIATLLGYKNLQSFKSSSAHERIMNGIEEIIKIVASHKDL